MFQGAKTFWLPLIAGILIAAGQAHAEIPDGYSQGLVVSAYASDPVSISAGETPRGDHITTFVDENSAKKMGYFIIDQDAMTKQMILSNNLSLVWEGFINVKESGNYLFMVIRKNNQVFTDGCNFIVYVDNVELIRSSVTTKRQAIKKGQQTDRTNVNFSSGIKKSRIFLECGFKKGTRSTWTSQYNQIIYEFLIKGPSDNSIRPVSSDFFIYKN